MSLPHNIFFKKASNENFWYFLSILLYKLLKFKVYIISLKDKFFVLALLYKVCLVDYWSVSSSIFSFSAIIAFIFRNYL